MIGRFSLIKRLANGNTSNQSRFSLSNVRKPIAFGNQNRNFVTVMALSYGTDNGLAPMLSKKALDIVYRQTYIPMVKKVNDSVYATEYEQCTLPEIIAKTMHRTDQYPLYSHAGFVSNSNHFLKPLTPFGTECPEQLEKMITSAYGGLAELRAHFTAYAKAVFGSAWIWLTLSEKGSLNFMVSYNGDPIEALTEDHPILCLSMWEHVYVTDFEKNVEEYVDGWWETINWVAVTQNVVDSKAYVNLTQSVVYGNKNYFPEVVDGASADAAARLNGKSEPKEEDEEENPWDGLSVEHKEK
eukprot:TRINITY_DN3627_c0_g1_i1.p1 TRINITY_DN3627_c0_g1~~TRINITY_DN3627_c0_g1_i1.p1  ORF type:complete len:298 (+),score=68.60 TRINITY_DN3627_c0_g1_i1:75-968(+)